MRVVWGEMGKRAGAGVSVGAYESGSDMECECVGEV